MKMRIREIAIKFTATLIITTTVMTSLSFTPATHAPIFNTIGTHEVYAASTKFPDMNEKLYKLIPKSTLDYNVRQNKKDPDPRYAGLTVNPFIMKQVLGTQKPEFAALAAETFSDVEGHWAAHLIPLALYSNLISGYPDGTFKPNQPVTKGEFAQMFAGTTMSPEQIKLRDGDTSARRDFGDNWWNSAYVAVSKYMPDSYGVKPSDNYGTSQMSRGAVAWAIANYFFADEIGPVHVDPVDRNEYPYLAKAYSGDTNAFTDTGKINTNLDPMNYYNNNGEDLTGFFQAMEAGTKDPSKGCPPQFYAAMACLKDKGIMAGLPDGSSGWNKPVTRAEVLQFIANAWVYVGENM